MKGFGKASSALALSAVAGLLLAACGTTGGSSDDNAGSGGGGSTGASSGASGGSGGSAACGYKIGYLGAVTGPNGNLGTNMVDGINTALAAYNSAHSGCEVTLLTEDSQGDATQATSLATQLINDPKVLGVVGPGFSGESEATGAAFFQAGLTTISPSATAVDLTTKGWTTFHRVLANDAAQGPAAAKYLQGKGAKKVFVIDDSEAYGTGLADSVTKALGSSVAGKDSFEKDKIADVLSGLVTKIKAANADAVFLGGYYADSGLLAKALRQAGWNGIFESGDGSEDPGFIKTAGAQGAEGAVLTAAAAPSTADFASKYKDANKGVAPGLYSAEAFDAANVFLDGLASGISSRADMLDFVNSYDKPGITKEIKFTPTGEVTTQTIYAYVVKGGQIQPGTPIE
jgi:branched-chain amino acid transport system substrate-binding protein